MPAPLPPFHEPPIVAAGDVWTWRTAAPRYPISDGYVLSYGITGAGNLEWDAAWATNDGEIWTVAIPSATTAPLTVSAPNGSRYDWAAYMTLAGARATVRRGAFLVLPDLATAAAGATASHAETMVRVLEAEIAARVTGDGSAHQHYLIGNHEVSKIQIEELHRLLGIYRTRLQVERSEGRLGRRVVARFGHGAWPRDEECWR